MSCRNRNNGCGCNRHGGIETKPPCNCEQHEECVGNKCSELISAECVLVQRENYEFSLDNGASYDTSVSLMDSLIAIANNTFKIREAN